MSKTSCTPLPIFELGREPAIESDCNKHQAARKMWEEAADANVTVSTRRTMKVGSTTMDGIIVTSGFFVSPTHVVTNAHGVHHTDSVTVTTADKHEKRATVESLDKVHDLAVLRLDNGQRWNKFMKLGSSTSVTKEKGQTVYLLGHPYGLESTYISPGTFVAGPNTFDRIAPPGAADELINDGFPESAATALKFASRVQSRIGSSGGPVVNTRGEVVAINQAGSRKLGFSIPVEYLWALLKKPKSEPEKERNWQI